MTDNNIYGDSFDTDTDFYSPLFGANTILLTPQQPPAPPASVNPIVNIDDITFTDIGDANIGMGIIVSGEDLGQVLNETSYKALSRNTDLENEGFTILIHICKYVTDVPKDSVDDKDLSTIVKFFCRFVEDHFMVIKSPLEKTQNFIQSVTSLFIKYAFDDRINDNIKVKKALMLVYNNFNECYKSSNKLLRESVVFCYKNGYIPKLLQCLDICSSVQNVLDTIKSFVSLRTSKPIFTDEEKLLIFKITKKGLLDLVPEINYDFVIDLTKDLYLFLPDEVDGMPSHEAADRILIETLLEFWKTENEKHEEKKALSIIERSFLRSDDKPFKWATPKSIEEMVQRHPGSAEFFSSITKKKHTHIFKFLSSTHLTSFYFTYNLPCRC